MEEEALNPEFVERLRQATDIDWSKVTPDMFVTQEEWSARLRRHLEEVHRPRLRLVEQLLAAYLVEMDLRPTAIEHLVLAERRPEDGVALISVDWIRNHPLVGVEAHSPHWATNAFERLETEDMRAYLETQAANYREHTDIPAHEAMLVETKSPEGEYSRCFMKRDF